MGAPVRDLVQIAMAYRMIGSHQPTKVGLSQEKGRKISSLSLWSNSFGLVPKVSICAIPKGMRGIHAHPYADLYAVGRTPGANLLASAIRLRKSFGVRRQLHHGNSLRTLKFTLNAREARIRNGDWSGPQRADIQKNTEVLKSARLTTIANSVL